jgi:hypothetical protein
VLPRDSRFKSKKKIQGNHRSLLFGDTLITMWRSLLRTSSSSSSSSAPLTSLGKLLRRPPSSEELSLLTLFHSSSSTSTSSFTFWQQRCTYFTSTGEPYIQPSSPSSSSGSGTQQSDMIGLIYEYAKKKQTGVSLKTLMDFGNQPTPTKLIKIGDWLLKGQSLWSLLSLSLSRNTLIHTCTHIRIHSLTHSSTLTHTPPASFRASDSVGTTGVLS